MNQVRVGISVFVVKGDDVLLGRRKGSHGEGQWAFPGGKQEYGETVFEGALRELAEEVGPEFKVTEMNLLCVGDLLAYMPKHFLDIGLVCEYSGGEPVVMEPDKCSEWKWFPITDLPDNLFASVLDLVAAYDGYEMYWSN